MNWMSVKDQLPKSKQNVKFLHDGYEFDGVFIAEPFPFSDPFFPTKSEWFFSGKDKSNRGKVTTIHVTHWMPLPEKPNELD